MPEPTSTETAHIPAPSRRRSSPAWSLQRRLRWQVLAAMAGLWMVAALLAVGSLRHELDEVLDSALVATAHRVLGLPLDASAPPGANPFGGTIQLQLLDANARILWRSPDAPEVALFAPGSSTRIFTHEGRRVAVEPSEDGQRIGVAMEFLEERQEAAVSVMGSLIGPVLLLLPLTAILVSWLLRQGFQPLENMRQELAARPPGDLRPVHVSGLPEELEGLAGTLESTLQRVAELRRAELAFAANSAHELRTPLAAARAQAQRLLAEVEASGPRERARSLIRQIDRLETLTVKLLQLSRIHSGLALSSEPVDLGMLADLVCREFNERGTRLTWQAPPKTVLGLGDLDALGIALRNLIQNALRHAGPDAQVRVELHPPASIEVRDDGPGVDAATMDSLRQPFARGTSEAPGHGLGLSIADEVARQSGGHLELASPSREGRGFSATLVLRPAPSQTGKAPASPPSPD